jgi:hypothetical protein
MDSDDEVTSPPPWHKHDDSYADDQNLTVPSIKRFLELSRVENVTAALNSAMEWVTASPPYETITQSPCRTRSRHPPALTYLVRSLGRHSLLLIQSGLLGYAH